MPSIDIHSQIRTFPGVFFQAIVTATIVNGSEVSVKGFHGVEYILYVKDIVDGDFSLFLEDRDDIADPFVEVEDRFLVGTEAGTTFFGSGNNDTITLGYIGHKKFIRPNVRTVGGTVSGSVLVIGMFGDPQRNPITQNPSPPAPF